MSVNSLNSPIGKTGNPVAWRFSPLSRVLIVGSLLCIGILFADGLREMAYMWFVAEQYSHGVLIPFIALFLVWQKRPLIEQLPFVGAWSGVLVVLAGVMLWLAGELSTLYIIVQYAFVITLAGLAIASVGWRVFRTTLVAWALLALMIPLPVFLNARLSGGLQLVSSWLGVLFIRLFGISVHLEGNVIDLGVFKLGVVEACSGLRYLFPLMALGVITGYFFKAPLWQRFALFLSSAPIAILMNSLRIGVIGVMVEYGGIEMAQGFLHDFEGWVVFMASTALLVLEMIVLARLSGKNKRLSDVFAIDLPTATPSSVQRIQSTRTGPLISAVLLLVVAVFSLSQLPDRTELTPSRLPLKQFPTSFSDWRGHRDKLSTEVLDVLKLDDYLMADFVASGQGLPINFYVAYYNSQRKGESAHSPRACLPGGGWRIDEQGVKEIPEIVVAGRPLKVNRMLIKLGDNQSLVYYWFQQRGRVITSEYMVKWYLFWDSLTRKRTDGALVRLVVPVNGADGVDRAEHEMITLLSPIVAELPRYIPD